MYKWNMYILFLSLLFGLSCNRNTLSSVSISSMDPVITNRFVKNYIGDLESKGADSILCVHIFYDGRAKNIYEDFIIFYEMGSNFFQANYYLDNSKFQFVHNELIFDSVLIKAIYPNILTASSFKPDKTIVSPTLREKKIEIELILDHRFYAFKGDYIDLLNSGDEIMIWCNTMDNLTKTSK